MIVRPAKVEDARAIAEVQVESMRAAYSPILPAHLIDAYDVDEFAEGRRVSITQRRAQGGETFVAARDGSIVGFATCGAPRDADIDPRTTGELLAIFVGPAAWGHGAGPLLLDAAERHLAARALSDVYLWVFEQNARARRFYERCGYVPDGTSKPNDGYPPATELRYRKPLS